MTSHQGTASVLLIDDHPAICDGAAVMLRRDGRFSPLAKAHKENIKQKLGLANAHQLMRAAITFSLSHGSAGLFADKKGERS